MSATRDRDRLFGIPQAQHYVVICSRVGPGDGPYLDEWVAYHLAAGVDHIFLGVDPDADPATKRTTRRWLGTKFVTRFRWNKTNVDVRILDRTSSSSFAARCYDVVAPRTRWMALIDTDEFIVPHGCSIPDTIDQFCHPLIPWIPLIWTMFGSSHREDRHCGANLVIEDFVWSGGNCSHMCKPGQGHSPFYCGECRHTKAIANTFCARGARHAHNHWVNHLDEMPGECLQAAGLTHAELAGQADNPLLVGRPMGRAVSECNARLQLHHFGTLSRAEFFARRSRRRRDATHDLHTLWALHDLNHEARPQAQRFSTAVRRILALRTAAPLVRGPQCPVPPAVLAAAEAGRWRSVDLEAAARRALPPRRPTAAFG
eukprot:EG_transcript_11110